MSEMMSHLLYTLSLVSSSMALSCYQTNTATWRDMELECPQGTIYCVKVTDIPMYNYRPVR
ncbi:hypothetical protein AAVH_40405 [Aphelenchoides avenae]|nr:hypothetical protein AAVH_40405 [Aphelenchus avenae]